MNKSGPFVGSEFAFEDFTALELNKYSFATTPPTIADNDVFFGARLALNDVQGTAILAGATVDLDNQSTVFIIEFERRLNNSLSLEAAGRFFINTQDDVILQNFENDSFIDVNVIWSF